MDRNTGSQIYQILNHGSQSSSSGFFSVRRPVGQVAVVFPKTLLPAKAQQVIGQQGQRQNIGIGRKVCAGQSFQTHVRLDLRMKLFAGSMVMVQQNHRQGGIRKGCPPGVHFNFRHQQALSFFDCSLDDFKNNPQGLAKPIHLPIRVPVPYGFTITRRLLTMTLLLSNLQPILKTFPTKIAFNQPFYTFFNTVPDVVRSIISGSRRTRMLESVIVLA